MLIKPMPRKTQPKYLAPTLVLERVSAWGLCIRNLSLQHRMRASDLCERMSITHSTLRRLENGDVGAGVGLYLNALMILGALEVATPLLPGAWTNPEGMAARVRLPAADGQGGDGDDYF